MKKEKHIISITLVASIYLTMLTGCSSTSKIFQNAEERSTYVTKNIEGVIVNNTDTVWTESQPQEEIPDDTVDFEPYAGALVTFGTYADVPIEWIVLDKDEEGVLFLVSKYVLDAQPYDVSQASVSWEKCSLRQWLNSSFYTLAFNEEEQTAIQPSTVVNDDYDLSGTFYQSGNTTSDKVFILNCKEVKDYLIKYFPSICRATDHAVENGALLCSKEESERYAGYCDWWYRTNGEQDTLQDMTNLSLINGEVDRTKNTKIGVRPAIRVNAEAVKPTSSAIEHIGDTVKFGTYQGNPLEWNILEKNEYGEVLLLSSRVIDAKPFDETPYDGKGNVCWANSSLRNWLNGEFYSASFTPDEQNAIIKKKIEDTKDVVYADNSQTFSWDTEDCVFLLSQAEISAELSNGHVGFVDCGFTSYAQTNGLNCDSVGFSCDYWFRNPGNQAGTISSSWTKENGRAVNDATSGVRPAIWVQAEALGLSSDSDMQAPASSEPIRPYVDCNVSLQIGDIVSFGSYGGEDLQWIILDKNAAGDAALVINKKVVDAKPYYTGTETLTSETAWGLSTLREWLNASFLEQAFTESERSRVLETHICDGSTETDDLLYLLSYDEMNKYIYEFTPCQATYYATTQGVLSSSYYYDYASYWLRSGGVDPQPARVSMFGQYYRMGELSYGEPSMGVRPAMWVMLPSDVQVTGHYDQTKKYIDLDDFPANQEPITWNETPVDNYTFVCTSDVAIRKGPGQEYEAVGVLPEGYMIYQSAEPESSASSEYSYIRIQGGYYLQRDYLTEYEGT